MDVFFNPSVTESFGNVTLEAMAAGVPVVGADAIGADRASSIDGETGFLVAARATCTAMPTRSSDWRATRRCPPRWARPAMPRRAGYEWECGQRARLDAYLATLAAKAR